MGKRFLLTIVAMMMAAAAVIPAAADDRGSYGNRGRGNGYGSYGRDRGARGGNPVVAAMRDLESIFRRARVDDHEADHFRRALRELDQFDQRAARGRFDRGSLNSALDNMGDLAQADQLHPRDRQLIRRHMQDLRFLREGGMRYY